MAKPYYQDKHATIYHGDAREVLPTLEPVDLVLTDPPYPNCAGHFDDGIPAARAALSLKLAPVMCIFWDEITRPPEPHPLVAIHIWHRSNTNRPDNYEPIYIHVEDGKKKASRVLSYPVVYPGLTGCVEATGHPTQKPEKLIKWLISEYGGSGDETILDPFMGSGTTLRAAKDLGRRAIGIEIEERYCEIAARRLAQEVLPL